MMAPDFHDIVGRTVEAPVTEDGWLSGGDVMAMLEHLRDTRTASDRKLRLFAAACCRAVWADLTTGSARAAVEVAERYADGLAAARDLHRTRSMAFQAAVRAAGPSGLFQRQSDRQQVPLPLRRLLYPAEAVDDHKPFLVGRPRWAFTDDDLLPGPSLLRDIFGSLPFRLTPPAPFAVLCWNNSLVVRLAEQAYSDRLLPSGHLDPQLLSVLADALEEAGAGGELMEHLRGPGPASGDAMSSTCCCARSRG